ncbi:MAG TPA: helix-turn-helix transcriptional regulator [Steroidobacteraceae bacterium]
MMKPRKTFGEELRTWRQRRHLSQLELATEVDISTRHLSFMETGRSQASRAMVLRLAQQLDVPLRERNDLLIAAGFAPMYAQRPLSDPSFDAVRDAVNLILRGHEPYPALLVDRHWTLVSANQAAQAFMAGVDPELLEPPVNVLRLSLHPRGSAPNIVNLAEWRAHVLARLARDVEITADTSLAALLSELRGYPGGEAHYAGDPANASVVVPLKLRTPEGAVLSFFSTTTVFGTAVEVTLSELVLEAFYPADDFTAAALRQQALPAQSAA